jgi:hypothetical protein
MTESTREAALVDAFTTLADSLVAGFDVIELLQSLVETCHDLLDVSEGGILLADDSGELEVVASTRRRGPAGSASAPARSSRSPRSTSATPAGRASPASRASRASARCTPCPCASARP